MDKKIFLLDKSVYTKEMVESLTEKNLEEWVAEEDYDNNDTIIKIDGNGYGSVTEALEEEFPFCDLNDYYVFDFGF